MAGQLSPVGRMSRRKLGALMLGLVVVGAAVGSWAWWHAWSAPLVTVLMRPNYSVEGLASGTPVRVRGVVVGQVASIGLHEDVEGMLRPELILTLDPESLEDRGFADRLRGDLLHEEVARGLVGRLVSVSPASGMLQVELAWEPGVRPAAPLAHGEIPAVGGTLQQTYERLAEGFADAARRDLALIAHDLESDLDRLMPFSDPALAVSLNAKWVSGSERFAVMTRELADGPSLGEMSRICLQLREAAEAADGAITPERIVILQMRLAEANAALQSFATALESSGGAMEGASAELSAALRSASEAAKALKGRVRGFGGESSPAER